VARRFLRVEHVGELHRDLLVKQREQGS
jgi:hypothetical protein